MKIEKLLALLEAMTKKEYQDWFKDNVSVKLNNRPFNKLFNGKQRISFPIIITDMKDKINSLIKSTGHEVDDYVAGTSKEIVSDKDKVNKINSAWFGLKKMLSNRHTNPNSKIQIEKLISKIREMKQDNFDNNKQAPTISSLIVRVLNDLRKNNDMDLYNELSNIKDLYDTDDIKLLAPIKNIDNQYRVIISRHPYDIIGMSTGRTYDKSGRKRHFKEKDNDMSNAVPDHQGWRSCMNLRDGVNKRYISAELEIGTLVAYLIKESDYNGDTVKIGDKTDSLDRAYSRITIKPFIDKNDPDKVILGVDNSIYGIKSRQFQDFIVKWADKINDSSKLSGSYELHHRAYDDGTNLLHYVDGEVFDINTFMKMGDKINKDNYYNLLDNLKTVHAHRKTITVDLKLWNFTKKINEKLNVNFIEDLKNSAINIEIPLSLLMNRSISDEDKKQIIYNIVNYTYTPYILSFHEYINLSKQLNRLGDNKLINAPYRIQIKNNDISHFNIFKIPPEDINSVNLRPILQRMYKNDVDIPELSVKMLKHLSSISSHSKMTPSNLIYEFKLANLGIYTDPDILFKISNMDETTLKTILAILKNENHILSLTPKEFKKLKDIGESLSADVLELLIKNKVEVFSNVEYLTDEKYRKYVTKEFIDFVISTSDSTRIYMNKTTEKLFKYYNKKFEIDISQLLSDSGTSIH